MASMGDMLKLMQGGTDRTGFADMSDQYAFTPRAKPEKSLEEILAGLQADNDEMGGEEIIPYEEGFKDDFTFIDDAVNIVVNILQYYVKKKKKSIYEIYNVGTNQPVKLKKFIKIIEKKLGKISKKKFLKLQKGDVKTTTCDTSKISKFLPKKLTSLDNGIEKFLSWYKKHY